MCYFNKSNSHTTGSATVPVTVTLGEALPHRPGRQALLQGVGFSPVYSIEIALLNRPSQDSPISPPKSSIRIHGISPRELKGPFFAFFRPKSRNVEKRKVSQCDDFRSVLELFFTKVKGLQFDPMVHWVQLSELDLNPLSAAVFTSVQQFYRRW